MEFLWCLNKNNRFLELKVKFGSIFVEDWNVLFKLKSVWEIKRLKIEVKICYLNYRVFKMKSKSYAVLNCKNVWI